ncbi:hypothetical protein ACFXTH_003775 [Malus domestica]
MARIKVHELRHKTKPDLLAQLKDLKSELALLRILALNLSMTYRLCRICKFISINFCSVGRRRWSAEGLNLQQWRSFDIVNNGLGLGGRQQEEVEFGFGLAIVGLLGLWWRKMRLQERGRVEERKATGERESVDSGINETKKRYCCPKNYKFVSCGLEQVVPGGKVEPKNG